MTNDSYDNWDQQKRTIYFKGERVIFTGWVRLNICSKCGRKGLTHLHHWEYDKNDPLKYTEEFCVSCHKRADRLCKKWKEGIECVM